MNRSGRNADKDAQVLLNAALKYRQDGLRLTLCQPGGKKPLGVGWSATSCGTTWPKMDWSAEKIQRAFKKLGVLNVGLLVGPCSGIIDIEGDAPAPSRICPICSTGSIFQSHRPMRAGAASIGSGLGIRP